jgi:hypothetical protein
MEHRRAAMSNQLMAPSENIVARCILILLIPLELDFRLAYRNGGRGHTQELVDQQAVPSTGRSKGW